VGYAAVAAGDLVVVDGRRRQIAAVVQTRTGFVLQFADTTVVHIVCAVGTCRIDGRQVRLDDIPAGSCFWCGTARRLMAVGRYHSQSGYPHTVYGCTACVAARGLLPLATRNGTDTEVRCHGTCTRPSTAADRP
jgi:hypothetical protein